MENEEFKPLMPFFDESHSFTNGFECGMLWVKMQAGEPIGGELPVHTENLPQIQLMCKHFGYEIEVKPYDETWTFIKTKHANQQPGPANRRG